MAKIRPYNYQLGFETTFGQTPTGADLKQFDLCIQEDGVTFETEYGDEAKCFGDIDAGGLKEEQGEKVEGAITSKGYFESLPIWLKLMMGDGALKDNNDGTFMHTFKSSTDNSHSAYAQTVVGKNDDYFSQVNGIMADKFSFDIDSSKGAESQLSVIASKYTDNKKDTALAKYTEANKVTLDSTPINYRKVSVKIDGVEDCNIGNITIDIDRGLKKTPILCPDGNGYQIDPEQFSVSGKISSLWGEELYKKMIDGQLHRIAVEIFGKDEKVGIVMEECQFEAKSQPKKVGEVYNVETSFTAIRKVSPTKLQVDVINKVSSY